MALEPVDKEPPAETLSSASTRTIERAQESVVQVRSRGRGAGAGVIWDACGLVLTNHHVLAGRRRGGKVQVTLHDSRVLDTEVARRSSDLDLALLRVVDSSGALPAAPVGDSDALRVGELVFAVGHPWGRLGVVTAGIVSGLDAAHGPGRMRYIQSDVSLAPGNSGGPLLNARGRVVGINAMISGGMAFAIPSNVASAWSAGARKPRLGVGILPVELPDFLRREDRSGEMGFVIFAVERGGPADRAGLLVGDVLLGMDDIQVHDARSLSDALSRAGDTGRLRLARGGVGLEIDIDFRRARGPGRAA